MNASLYRMYEGGVLSFVWWFLFETCEMDSAWIERKWGEGHMSMVLSWPYISFTVIPEKEEEGDSINNGFILSMFKKAIWYGVYKLNEYEYR